MMHMIIWLNMELRVINAQKGNAMRITVSFDGERNEELIARLNNTNGDRICRFVNHLGHDRKKELL